tara:strand:+ start:131 stop:988 length:858 start_codon:yes stop_codon:yes gene_type:complete
VVKIWSFLIGFFLLAIFLGTWKVSAQGSNTPDAPTNLKVEASNETLAVSWGPPLNNNGSEITGYQFNWSGPNSSGMSIVPSFSAVLESLSNGTSYSLSVSAINSNGVGVSTGEVLGIPYTIPDSPSSLSAQIMDGILVLNWNPPVFNGGSPINGYRIESREIGTDLWKVEMENTGSAFTTHNIVSWDSQVSKEFQISAINQAGMGAVSSPFVFEPEIQISEDLVTTTTQLDSVTTTTLPLPTTCTTLPTQDMSLPETSNDELSSGEEVSNDERDMRIPLPPIYIC